MSQSDIINSRQIQWFPGHMTKTLRLMEKEIRNVDCVLQILDARIPRSPGNGWPTSRVRVRAALRWTPSSADAPRLRRA